MSTQDCIYKELCVAVSTAIAIRSAIHNGISTRMSTGIHMSMIWLREITKPPVEYVNWGFRYYAPVFARINWRRRISCERISIKLWTFGRVNSAHNWAAMTRLSGVSPQIAAMYAAILSRIDIDNASSPFSCCQ